MTKHIWFLGTTLLLVAVAILFSAHRAEAQYTTPVRVTNTTSSPGSVLDADLATRIPYQSRVAQTCPAGVNDCFFTFPAAPAGYRLVIQNVSGTVLIGSAASTPPFAILNIDMPGGPGLAWGIPGALGIPGRFAGFNQSVLAWADPANGQPEVTVDANFSSGYVTTVTLSGYLINCSVVGCPAIQK